MSFNSKYSGQQVENLLDQVANGNTGGSGGGGSSSGSSSYPLVNHGTSDTTFTLTPNTFHVWNEVVELDLSLAGGVEGVVNEYLFQFTSGETATSLTLPDTIKWVAEPTVEPNKTYQISIVNNIGLFVGV